MRTGVEPGHGMGVMGTGTGTGHHDTYGTGHTGMGTGMGTGGMGTGHTGAAGPMGGAGTGYGAGSGYDAEGKETMGHKIKKMIPGGRIDKLCSFLCLRQCYWYDCGNKARSTQTSVTAKHSSNSSHVGCWVEIASCMNTSCCQLCCKDAVVMCNQLPSGRRPQAAAVLGFVCCHTMKNVFELVLLSADASNAAATTPPPQALRRTRRRRWSRGATEASTWPNTWPSACPTHWSSLAHTLDLACTHMWCKCVFNGVEGLA
jgi:hypothetical protein